MVNRPIRTDTNLPRPFCRVLDFRFLGSVFVCQSDLGILDFHRQHSVDFIILGEENEI